MWPEIWSDMGLPAGWAQIKILAVQAAREQQAPTHHTIDRLSSSDEEIGLLPEK